ncbi:hypothetical protein [Luteolibacter sp. Populi]|uniref:hypothetical protein n=1 Tax=Luteolibacter sp. Populi TaxID=3230487 RepID=UPI003467C005
MKYRPSRGLVFCLVPLLATGGTAAWAWSKANDVPLQARAHGDFFELLKRKKSSLSNYDAAEWAATAKSMRAESVAAKQKLLAEFPALAIESKPVPEAENGFLMLHKFSGFPPGAGPKVGTNLTRVLHDRTEWNAEAVKAALAEHPVEVARAEEIAAMPARSSSGMPDDYIGFIGARTGKFCADVLLLKARLAAEAKDETETLRLVAATRNLVRHYREIEQPSLLAETVAILIDLSVTECAFKHLLPDLGPAADLPRWKEALVTRGYTPADFGHVMRGEWNIASEFYLIPMVLQQKPADSDKLLRTYASNFESLVKALPGMSWDEFAGGGCESLQEGFSHLSDKSREIADDFSIGCKAWTKGYVRAASMLAMHQAALDLMILEKSGEKLDTTAVEKIIVEPISGTRFAFDPGSRILTAPERMKEFDVREVKLP